MTQPRHKIWTSVMGDVARTLGLPIVRADNWWLRWQGLRIDSVDALWMDGTRWVHSFGLTQPFLAIYPCFGSTELSAVLEIAAPRRILQPRWSAAGILEIRNCAHINVVCGVLEEASVRIHNA